jgi:hypothetical protein
VQHVLAFFIGICQESKKAKKISKIRGEEEEEKMEKKRKSSFAILIS